MDVGIKKTGAWAEMGDLRSRLLAAMYGVNVIGAGIPGLATVLAYLWRFMPVAGTVK